MGSNPDKGRSTIPANSSVDVNIDWIPVVGEHTCLRIWAEQQLGEITGGNNWVQENVFDFDAPASSVPDPIMMDVAVRNPLKEKTIVLMSVKGVPIGYKVHFPHSWLWLEPLEERKLQIAIIPTNDYNFYRDVKSPSANIRLAGDISHSYQEKIFPGVHPASRMFAIGGVLTKVTPKRRVDIKIQENKKGSSETAIAVNGVMSPPLAGDVLRVDLIDPDDLLRTMVAKTDSKGRFGATFDLRTKSQDDNKRKKEQKEKPREGIYKIQALVINSKNAAQTESNVVYVNKITKNRS